MLVQVVAKPMMLADRQQWQGTKTTLVTEWRKKELGETLGWRHLELGTNYDAL